MAQSPTNNTTTSAAPISQTATIPKGVTAQAQQQQRTVPLQHQQEQQQQQQQQIPRRQAVDVDKLIAENESLKQKVKVANAAIEEYKHTNENLSKRVANIEYERRKDKVASLLSGASYKQEEFDTKVESLTKSGLPIEEIESIVTPLISAAAAAASKTAVESNNNDNNNAQATEAPEATAPKQASCGCNGKHATKSANYENNNAGYSSKVAIRNAKLEDATNDVNEASVPAGPPSFLVTRNYLFNGGAQ